LSVSGAAGFAANGTAVIPAAAGLRSKILAFNIYCTLWTSEGTVSIKDGTAGPNLFLVARITTPGIGQGKSFDMGGKAIGIGSVNTLVELNYTAAATLQYTILYYQAP
jgi:hypothetical protein